MTKENKYFATDVWYLLRSGYFIKYLSPPTSRKRTNEPIIKHTKADYTTINAWYNSVSDQCISWEIIPKVLGEHTIHYTGTPGTFPVPMQIAILLDAFVDLHSRGAIDLSSIRLVETLDLFNNICVEKRNKEKSHEN